MTLDFHEAVLMAAYRRERGEITKPQYDLIVEIDALFDRMSGAEKCRIVDRRRLAACAGMGNRARPRAGVPPGIRRRRGG